MRSRRRQRGFSLFELLLVVVILLALLSSFVINWESMRRGAELTEGVVRLEALLRFARAEAALRGKRVRVEPRTSVPEETWESAAPATEPLHLSWEPSPLAEPGRFDPLPPVGWADRPLAELLGIEEARWPDDPEPAAAPEAADDRLSFSAGGADEESIRGLVFDPEGSSDSIELVVYSVDLADTRRLLVTLDGLTGQVTHRELGEEELAERQRAGTERSPSESASATVGSSP